MHPARTAPGLPFKQIMAFSLGLLVSSNAVSKDFYRWIDEHGTTHYSSHPPADKSATKVRTSNIKGEPAPAATHKTSDKDTETLSPSDKFDESAKAPVSPKAKAQKKENCKRAKFNLKTLKEKPRIRVKEGDDYRFIDQKERKEKIKVSEESVEKYCD